MIADQLYLGIFSGALAMLFAGNVLFAYFLKESKFIFINFLILCLYLFFDVDKQKFSGITGLNSVESWIISGVVPLFLAMITVTLFVRDLTALKQESPGMDGLALFSIASTAVGIGVCLAPFITQLMGHPAIGLFFEGLILSPGVSIVAVISIVGWSSIFFTPVQKGEMRTASATAIGFMALFLIGYALVLQDVLPLNEITSNFIRVAAVAGVASTTLAYVRHAGIAEQRRERNKSDSRDRAANREEKQRAQALLKQAHVVRVLQHEKALEAELRMRETERLEALREAKEAADEVARNKSHFLAFMSHEIRTPLNGIMGMVRLLSNTALSAQQRDFVETLSYSGDALLSLVNNTLDLSKIEAGQLELENIDFDLERLVGSNVTLMSARASEKGLLIRSDIGSTVPRFLKGDPTRLRQILLNLINNAIKFTEEGGITIAVRVQPDPAAGKHRLRFEVQDTGVGIPESAKDRLFKEYSQVDVSTARLYGGTGLGLSICKELVAAMGGKIGVDSLEGQGSTFWFVLDFFETDGSTEIADAEPPSSAQKLSILVVEDNEIHQKVIAGYLKFDGHKVVAVSSAEEALDHFATENFDIVLMDVNLPGINGNEATRRIRAMPQKIKSSVPVIAITGNTAPVDIDECRQAGMNDFLGKPVDPEILRSTVLTANKLWRQQHDSHGDNLLQTAPSNEQREPLLVLVVDDNEINQKVVAGYLAADGNKHETASNGERAVAMAGAKLYDLILMDVNLPGIDGLEASRRIRALEDPVKNQVPIVALTGNVAPEDIKACRDAGMNDFLGKPIDPASLQAVLGRLERHMADPLDDYLPNQNNGPILLDDAVMTRLIKTFERPVLVGLMNEMLSESAQMIVAMQHAAINENQLDLRAKAHALKGMAMTLGVVAVGEKAADIESAVARAEKAPALMGMITQLQQIFEQSKTRILAWQTE